MKIVKVSYDIAVKFETKTDTTKMLSKCCWFVIVEFIRISSDSSSLIRRIHKYLLIVLI